uniref:SHSP domain-containing protein n=1 Tax=Pseudo-nitzschia australis TaxID=44445 RepID=A0A7S4EM23_9STRA|mmetsp:Transcript_25373/g.55603  ORF Transcript_25373/g.55603 Transcript_25373/m.55603 type:complete len:141 (+) Transcript_25373:259-681(+)
METPISNTSTSTSTRFPYNITDEGSNIKIHEDETCFLLSIEMPDFQEKDLQVSLQRNILTISGFRRSCSQSYSDKDDEYNGDRREAPGYNYTSTKRQRLSRQLEIDPNAIDIERAMASTWNGCYTLYAPKRLPQFRGVIV